MGMTVEVMADFNNLVEGIVRTIPRRVVEALYEANPLDTSHSRNNWIVSIGEPWTGIDGTRENPSNQVQQEALKALDGYRLKDGMLYINNNVHYVIFLDLGWSKQASAGWVQRSIETGLMATARGVE